MNIISLKNADINFSRHCYNNPSLVSSVADVYNTQIKSDIENAFMVKQNAQKLRRAVELLAEKSPNELQKFGIFNVEFCEKKLKSFSIVDKNNVQNDYKFNSDGTVSYVAKNVQVLGKLKTIKEFYCFGNRNTDCCLKKYNNFEILNGVCNFESGVALFNKGFIFYPSDKNRKIALEIYNSFCKS